MDDREIFTIVTTMEKEDYRKFLYISTFKKNPRTILMIIAMSFAGAMFGSWIKGILNPVGVGIMWLFMAATLILGIVIKIEAKYKQRVSTDNTGNFGSEISLHFYSTYVVMENAAIGGRNQLDYSQFYKLIECKEYYIFYYNENMASLVRKKDINDLEKAKLFFIDKFSDRYKYI